MKKLFLLIFCLLIVCTNAYGKDKRDYSLITNDKTIMKILDSGFPDETIEYLKGNKINNINHTPIRIEFKNMKELGQQYDNTVIITWQNIVETADGKQKFIYFYINDKCKNLDPYILYCYLAPRIYNIDEFNSINEELFVSSDEAATWLLTKSILKNIKDDNNNSAIRHLNNVANLYENGNYTNKYLKQYVKNRVNVSLPQTSPGYETEKEPYFTSELKRINTDKIPTTKLQISSSPIISEAVEEIRQLPFGEKLYKKIEGDNCLHLPIRIEFMRMYGESSSKTFAIQSREDGRINIYLNSRYQNMPKEAIASLIIGSLSTDESAMSYNELVYYSTLEAAAWTYFVKKNPKLQWNLSTPVLLRLNPFKEQFVKGNYTDKYLRILISTIPGYKNLPATSPGFETIPSFDNSIFNPVNETIITDEINKNKSNDISTILLKGTFAIDDKPVDNNKFNLKIKYDNTVYSNEKKNLSQEQYHLYRILERVVRANNIDFTPWRLIIVDNYNFNASSTDNNLVIINKGLYNKLQYNDDALALVISHELSHLLLNHLPEMHEYVQQIEYLERRSAMRQNNAYSGARNAINSYSDNTLDMIASIGWGAYSAINGVQASTDQLAIDKIWKKIQNQEFEADNEGFVLTHRAGYNLARATLTFDIMSTMPNVYTRRSTHPPVRARYINLRNNIPNMTVQQINDGKKNIYNSNVLKCHSDNTHKRFYIDKTANYNKMYRPESSISRQWRLAYNSYNSYRLDDAIFYLKDLSKLDHNNYIHPLYISYANEYLYRKTGSKKYLSESIKYAKKADKINQNNKHVQQQLYDLNNLR